MPVGWEDPSESESKAIEARLEWEPFSEIEALEARLEREGKHWSEWGRERVERAIERFWSVAFDLTLEPTSDSPWKPTAISPLQGFDVMHDWRGLFADWPAPPDTDEFKPARADYRAQLACKDRYIAENMWRYAKKMPWRKGDPALKQALRAKAESKDCSALAEVLKKLSKKGS